MSDPELLDRVDAYLDVVQRDSSDVEEIGPFTLFVSRAPYPLYARPRRGSAVEITKADLDRLAARCAEIGMALAVEWVEEVTPSLTGVVAGYGLAIERYPLLVLTADRFRPAPTVPEVELAHARSVEEIRAARAVAHVGFGHGGTGTGDAGAAERDASGSGADPDHLAWFADDAAAERTVTVTASLGDDGVVATGLVKPVDGAAEIMGVATLPAFRRRGLALTVTSALVEAALARGVELLLLSADSDDVARIYQRLGFRRLGHTGQAERARPPRR
ncbi:GNAT family N-acetyltransferase [Jatrophihabitans sp. YIM 134969]